MAALSACYRIAEAEKEGYGEMYETPLFDEVTGRPLNDKARKLVSTAPIPTTQLDFQGC